MFIIPLKDVILIHEYIIEPKELQGLAADKSLESCLMRVENRVSYGLVNDAFELAALYAVCIATGHCFNDANKRTAVNLMDVCLVLNGIELDFETITLGNKIVAVAQGLVDEINLAKWLRQLWIQQQVPPRK